MRRTFAWVQSLLLCLIVLSPLGELLGERKDRQDSFPLSYYPMFSSPRPDLERAVYVVALEGDGTRHTVSFRVWASGGWNQGRAQVHRYKNGKAGGLSALCRKVAAHMAEAESGWKTRVTDVRVVRGWYDREQYFAAGNELPKRELTLAGCAPGGA